MLLTYVKYQYLLIIKLKTMKSWKIFEKAMYVCAFLCLFAILQQQVITWEFALGQIHKAMIFCAVGGFAFILRRLFQTAD